MKKIHYREQARKDIVNGVTKIADAVGVSLGPLGRNVGLDKQFEKVIIHDGVKIAEQFELEDEFENFAAKQIILAAQNQVQKQGDGTTVTTILAETITKECIKLIEAGYNAMLLERGIEKSMSVLLKYLKQMAKPVKTEEEKIKIATIAANSSELGDKIGKILQKIGVDGVIDVEAGKGTETTIEHQEGMQFGPGYASPYFVTNVKRMEAVIENPYILISDKNIDNLLEFMPFTQKLVGKPQQVGNTMQLVGGVTRNIVLIAPDFSQDILSSGINTKLQGIANILCVRAPLFGEPMRNLLKDIAILTGGTVIGTELGTNFETLEVKVCGHAKKVVATSEATLIVGGKGDPSLLTDHIESLRRQLDEEEGAFNAEKLKERIGKLTSGVAVVKVGGHTETEITDRKERVDDAIHAVKSAIEGGIVPGGEMALFNMSLLPDSQFSDMQSARILKTALKRPFKKLLENAGIEYAEAWQKLSDKGVEYGVDVLDGKIKNLLEAGIIDPYLVVKSAIENAVSIAMKLSTTDCLIVYENPKPPAGNQ